MTRISVRAHYFSIAACLFLIQLMYLASSHNPTAMGFFHESQTQAMFTYSDSKFHYEIKYPNNWEKSVKLNNEVTFVAPKDTDSVSSPAGFVIKIVPTPGKNISSNSATKELTSQIQTEHKDFKMESNAPVTLDGKKATQVVFTATDSKLQNRKAMQIVVSNYENIYILTYKASTDKYGNYESLAKDIASSFKFLPKL